MGRNDAVAWTMVGTFLAVGIVGYIMYRYMQFRIQVARESRAVELADRAARVAAAAAPAEAEPEAPGAAAEAAAAPVPVAVVVEEPPPPPTGTESVTSSLFVEDWSSDTEET